jgi:hypothetical protein
MFQDTAIVYTGSLFHGNATYFLDFLCVVNDRDIPGKFMPVEYNYDTMSGIISVKLMEILGGELADIDYQMTIDYGEPIKPVIRG